MTTVERVRETLRDVVDPCSAATGSDLDIVEMGLLKSIETADRRVEVELRVTTPACHMVPYFLKEVRTRVGALSGVDTVDVTVDDGTEWTADMMSEAAKQRRREVLDEYEARYARDP